GRQTKFDPFLPAGQHRNIDRTEPPQSRDHVVDEYFRRRSTCRDANGLHALEPFGIQLAAVGDEIARYALLAPDLTQAIRIGTVGSPHDQHQVYELAQFAHRRLTVLRGVADVARFRADDVAELALESRDDVLRIVDTQR